MVSVDKRYIRGIQTGKLYLIEVTDAILEYHTNREGYSNSDAIVNRNYWVCTCADFRRQKTCEHIKTAPEPTTIFPPEFCATSCSCLFHRESFL